MQVRWTASLLLWFASTLALIVSMYGNGVFSGTGWLAVVLVSVFVADAGSYVFHYIVDHYGTPRPGTIVHAFQEHHLTPRGIVRRPLAEVLHPAARIVGPVNLALLPLFVLDWLPHALALVLLVLGCCWVLAQLFHRWAHLPRTRGLLWAVQSAGLLLSPAAHARHHRAPFDSHFAVITGWSNPLLDGIGAPDLLDRLLPRLGFEKRGLVRNLKWLAGLD